jgi:hypothetical protein
MKLRETHEGVLYIKCGNGSWMVLESGKWRYCKKPNNITSMKKPHKDRVELILKQYPV